MSNTEQDMLKDIERVTGEDRERTRTVAQRGRPDSLLSLIGGEVSPAMAIMLDDRLFDRARLWAKYLSEAKGFVPANLEGKVAGCFAVVVTAITWKLNPFMVAKSTYQTPGGGVGYEGKLVQAIIENSGKIVGGVEFQHYGDWDKLTGRFEITKEPDKKPYPKRLWDVTEAKGLGVIVSAQVKGETKKRTWDFKLVQAFPLNSTLWATDPKTQICYTAVRRFGNVVVPGLLMGVPFNTDDAIAYAAGDNARVVNDPEPVEPGAPSSATTVVTPYRTHDARGELVPGSSTTPDDFAIQLANVLQKYESAVDKLAFFSANMQEIERCIAEAPYVAEENGVMASLLAIYQGAEFDVQSEAFRKAEEEKPTGSTEVAEKPVEEKSPDARREAEDKKPAGAEDDFPGDRASKQNGNVVPLHDRKTGEVQDERNPPPPGAEVASGKGKKAAADKKKAEAPKEPDKPKISDEELKRYRVPVPDDDGVPNWMRWSFVALEDAKRMVAEKRPQREFMAWRQANLGSLESAAKRNKTAVTRIEAELKKGEGL